MMLGNMVWLTVGVPVDAEGVQWGLCRSVKFFHTRNYFYMNLVLCTVLVFPNHVLLVLYLSSFISGIGVSNNLKMS